MGYQLRFPSHLRGLLSMMSSGSAAQALEKWVYGMELRVLRELPLARDIERVRKLEKAGLLAMPSDEEILEALIADDVSHMNGPTAFRDLLPATLRAVAWRSIQRWRRRAAEQSLSMEERHHAASEAYALLATCRRHNLLEVPYVQ